MTRREMTPEDETWDDADFYGIYATEDDGGPPFAMFAQLVDAQKWLKQMQDADELGCDYCIVRTTVSEGTFRNHYEACEPTL